MSRFIQIDFQSLTNILSELQSIGDRASDLRPAARLIGIAISSYTEKVFDSSPSTQSGGTVFNGFVWDKLKPATLKANKGRRQNGKILRDTGALLNSLQVGGADNFFESGNDFVEFGTNLPQGFNNSTRPFLAHTDDLSDLVEKALENFIINGET